MFKREIDTTITTAVNVTAGQSIKIKYKIPGGCHRIYEGIVDYVSANGSDQYLHMASNPSEYRRRLESRNDGLILCVYEPERLGVYDIIDISIASRIDNYPIEVGSDGKLIYFTQFPAKTEVDVNVGDFFMKAHMFKEDVEHRIIGISGDKKSIFMENTETGAAIAISDRELDLVAKFRGLSVTEV